MEFRHCGNFFKSLWAGWPKKVGNFHRDSSRVWPEADSPAAQSDCQDRHRQTDRSVPCRWDPHPPHPLSVPKMCSLARKKGKRGRGQTDGKVVLELVRKKGGTIEKGNERWRGASQFTQHDWMKDFPFWGSAVDLETNLYGSSADLCHAGADRSILTSPFRQKKANQRVCLDLILAALDTYWKFMREVALRLKCL